METTTTTHQLAEEAASWWETASREDGSKFDRLKDGRPEWLHDLVREAHGRDHDGSPAFLPDDWRHEFARGAIDAIAYAGEDADLDDVEHEFADGAVPAYTSERLAWLSSHLQRPGYCDEAAETFGAEERELVDRVALGMYAEAREVFGIVRRELESRAEA